MQKIHLIFLLFLSITTTSCTFSWLGEWTVLSSCPNYCCCPRYSSAFVIKTRDQALNKLYATTEFVYEGLCPKMGINASNPFLYLPWSESTTNFDSSTLNSFNKMKRDVFRYVDVRNVSTPFDRECAFFDLDQKAFHSLESNKCPVMICRSDKGLFVNESAAELDSNLNQEFNVQSTDYETFMKYWPVYEMRKFSLVPYRDQPLIEKIFHVIQLENFGTFKIYSIEKTRLMLGEEWEIKTWKEKDLLPLLGLYEDFYENLRTIDMMYNFAALLVLQSEGGVIINPDALLIRNLDDLVHRYDYFIQEGFSFDGYLSKLFTNNQVFGARKGHPFLQDIIQTILQNYKTTVQLYDRIPYSEFCKAISVKDPNWKSNYGGQMFFLSLATTMWPYSYVFWNRSREDGNFIALSRYHFQPLDVNKPTSAAFSLYNFFNLSTLRPVLSYDTGNLQLDNHKLNTVDSQKYLLFSWSYARRNLAEVAASPQPLIPRILHVFIKEFKQEVIDTWKKVNKFWTVRAHVEDPTKWRCMKYRALIDEGGVVVDGDQLFPLYEFDELAHKYAFFAGLKDVKSKVYIDDSVIGAKQDHAILREAYDKTCIVDINDIGYLTVAVYENHDLDKNIVLPSGYFFGKDEHLDAAYTKLWIIQ